METVQLPLLRLAVRVHTAFRDNQHTESPADSAGRIASHLSEIQVLARKLRIAGQRRWSYASAILHQRLARRLRDLACDIPYTERRLHETPLTVPDLRTTLEELRQIEDEFGAVRLRRNDSSICVVTEPIVLEDLNLGPFELRLHLEAIAAGDWDRALTVAALDPRPCAHDDLITHPHVNAERICLGDAAEVVHQSLCEGRLADVFLVVRTVLRTYNASSPYCALSDWHGRACEDCGEVTREDDICCCPRCDQDYCENCFGACAVCDEAACHGCLAWCPLCEEPVCGVCLEGCAHCGEPACASCLDDGLCPTCLENPDEEDDAEAHASNEAAKHANPGSGSEKQTSRAQAHALTSPA